MKHRLTLLSSLFSVIVLAVLVLTVRLSLDDAPVTRASAEGTVLSVAALAPTERIVVEYDSTGCRNGRNWTFELSGGGERQLTVSDAGGSYETGMEPSDRPSLIGTISLSSIDCRGIDDLLRHYRHPDGSSGSTTRIRIRVSYFREGEKIGSEEFVDQGLIEHWIWHRDQRGTVPVDSGVTPEMRSFLDLFRRAAREHAGALNATVSVGEQTQTAGNVPSQTKGVK